MSWTLSESGSEIELADWTISGQGTIDWDITMTGGTLDIDRWFKTSGDLDISSGTAEIGATFDVSGDVDLSAGMLFMDYEVTLTGDLDISGSATLQVDEDFTGKGELDFSGGMIEVAAGKIAAFTPND